ncbi:MAG: KH domain-containing protein [Firmicutes bacterium]|nr:KH domain-containing protein [Bacillota bacterium]MCL2255386.1 KH domain-containing protein [Bacillota bacterium]
MVDLVKFMLEGIVDDKDAIVVNVSEGEISITVAKDDMKKVIGRSGRTAKAIRTIVRVAAAKNGEKYNVNILEVQQ